MPYWPDSSFSYPPTSAPGMTPGPFGPGGGGTLVGGATGLGTPVGAPGTGDAGGDGLADALGGASDPDGAFDGTYPWCPVALSWCPPPDAIAATATPSTTTTAPPAAATATFRRRMSSRIAISLPQGPFWAHCAPFTR